MRLASLVVVAALVVPAAAAAQDMSVERVRASAAPDLPIGDRVLTLVRASLDRYALRVLTPADGGPRTAPDWMSAQHLAAVVNASMFTENGGRSTGMLVVDGAARNARDNPLFGGFLAFGPRDGSPTLARVYGRGCPGTDVAALRHAWRNVVQSYRLLDCHGHAISWSDTKSYSAAAIGLDDRGRVVLVHVRTPYRMAVLARELAAPSLHLRSMLFVEGGPEASLVAHADGVDVSEMGSYETGFHESDDNRVFWELPNVIGLVAR